MESPGATVTIPTLQQMKRDGKKIVGVVAWDYQIAQIVDRVGVDIVSVGDTVGINLWGHSTPLEITMDEMLVVCKAVRRGVKRALVSCDIPFGPLQEGIDSALKAAVLMVKEAGADMIKLDGASQFPDAVRAISRAGIPVFAQFGITPQTALQYGIPYSAAAKPDAQVTPEMTTRFVEEARLLENAGASLLDFTNSGPVVGAQGRGCCLNSGGRRVWGRPVAGWTDADGSRCDRIRRQQSGHSHRELCQCRRHRLRRYGSLRRRCALQAPD